jgi:hypothetical protein
MLWRGFAHRVKTIPYKAQGAEIGLGCYDEDLINIEFPN